jgi:hypothetical protein
VINGQMTGSRPFSKELKRVGQPLMEEKMRDLRKCVWNLEIGAGGGLQLLCYVRGAVRCLALDLANELQ